MIRHVRRVPTRGLALLAVLLLATGCASSLYVENKLGRPVRDATVATPRVHAAGGHAGAAPSALRSPVGDGLPRVVPPTHATETYRTG
jgi:hypothetical protein